MVRVVINWYEKLVKNSLVESILLKFELDIRTSKLTKTSHYNSYSLYSNGL